MKIDDKTWVRAGVVGTLLTIAVSATILYMQFKARMDTIELLMQNDARQRTEERSSVTKSLDNLSDQIRKVFVDSVATRQAQGWIDMARALNREKNPSIVWPDLPR